MTCLHCGKILPEDACFCNICGAPQSPGYLAPPGFTLEPTSGFYYRNEYDGAGVMLGVTWFSPQTGEYQQVPAQQPEPVPAAPTAPSPAVSQELEYEQIAAPLAAPVPEAVPPQELGYIPEPAPFSEPVPEPAPTAVPDATPVPETLQEQAAAAYAPELLIPPPPPQPAALYPAPEGFQQDPATGLYYIYTRGSDPATGAPANWVTWFDPNTGQYSQQCYPV